MFNPDSVETEGKISITIISVLIIIPVIGVAYYRSPVGVTESVGSFFSLLFAGLFILVLYYKNSITVLKNSVVVTDAKHFKPVTIKYKDIANIKVGVGVLEFLTLTHFIRITDIKGNTYVVHCLTNGYEILDIIYDILRTINSEIEVL